MNPLLRMIRKVVATLLAFGIASVPACGTMGGGGMKYFADPPSPTPISAAV